MSFLDLPHEVRSHILKFLPFSADYIILTYFKKIFVPTKKVFFNKGMIIGECIHYDNVELFKLLLNNDLCYFNNIIRFAAYFGSMNILKYMIEVLPKEEGFINCIQLDEKVFSAACEGGHINILEYLLKISKFKIRYFVLKNNIISVIEWLKNNNFSLEHIAESPNNFELLQCLHQNNIKFSSRITNRTSNPKILKWLYSIDYKITDRVFDKKWDLETLKWLYNNGHEPTSYCYDNAAKNNNKEILDWLISINCPKSESTVNILIETDNLELLKWAKNNKFPFDVDVCYTAADNGRVEILKWLNDIGFAFDDDIIDDAIIGHFNIDSIEWLLSFGLQLNSEHYDTAITYNNINIIKYLIEKNIQFNNNKTYPSTNVKTLKVLVENGFIITDNVLLNSCERFKYSIVKWYLDSNYKYDKNICLDLLNVSKIRIEKLINFTTFSIPKLYREYIKIIEIIALINTSLN